MTVTNTSSARSGSNDAERGLVEVLRRRVARQLSERGRDVTGGDYEQLVWQLVDEALNEHARQVLSAGDRPLEPAMERRIAAAVRNHFAGLGGLQEYLDNPRVTQININGDEVFVSEVDGSKRRVPPVASSTDELVELIRMIAARSGSEERRFDRGVPRLNLQLPDGSRVFAAMAVSKVPVVSIRRHPLTRASLPDLVGYRMLDAGTAALLAALVKARKNVVISGGTYTGKTTLLRAMAREIPAHERLITIEDTFELGLRDEVEHPDCVELQVREPNIENSGAIYQDELVRWALRMSPDRVIVGEVRGAEVISLCQAMSQGNDGSLGTVHASSSQQALTRLMTYAVQVLPFEATAMLIAGAIEFVVHLAWSDRTRVVSSVRQVLHAEGRDVISNEILRPGRDKRAVTAAPLRSDTLDELVATGFRPDMLAGW
ncbi:CpaF family protein [Paractinoplanes toevensis]|uniref:Protein kinase n=1 Tax=Paractinoplanes toevensis TaxID=571911 RepID=A0A920BRM0_9ACTN|nr:ATPase, T2SS/T4P/T4SS family [Actinoplanes toevensis]GIM98248.1 protein kinase [Actinoplanes toevensis]